MEIAVLKCLRTNENLMFPVTPFINWDKKMKTESQTLFGFGEIGTGASEQLMTWTAKSFFPSADNDWYDFLVCPSDGTMFYINKINEWMKNQEVLRFYYYDNECKNNIDVNDKQYLCQITGFKHGEEDGSKDVKYEIDFREYKELYINQESISTRSEPSYYSGTSYTVKDGDTLLIIAQKCYGNSDKWRYIMKNNGLSNPLNIKTGQVLKI